ncbi:activator of HSP90 ATPase [Actinoplanes capillaceus]|uniref:Activator of HSP90 ATPase n=1 Tax=Actinoplanes campanulatus TaxID=113559 RepID=A0ABQ3WC32_9ACTN|nr:SRPBCC family protein [Actinoplanes capillaceus]GID42943.1 activator of HSP90 ATPase [Actinoplanes capillaceus]
MEYGTIEREIFIEAAPEIVFDVVSSPDHVKQWWPDDAQYDPAPGSTGHIVFGDCNAGGTTVQLTVVDARPPETFSFRWTHPAGETAAVGNSLLVTFDLIASGDGTLLRMTETGFREMGWSEAVLQHEFEDHVAGWTHFLSRIAPYADTLRVSP